MVMTDPIADMLTRIRNAKAMKRENVEILGSKLNFRILEVLKAEGYIKDVKFIEDDKQGTIIVTLKYTTKGDCAIKGLKRISKPGLRVYAKQTEIPKVLNGLGIAIVSTSKGIVTDRVARKDNVGGEILAYVW